ncbi:MBL fold metallo-hydrolase [Rivibacter subsaxonicus]|uniref:L-ascorbate metabolism protein UlaG (Beta-lactamase superfamily) n=1 Tax=Rivibacter subsaxonicus TaxID=457575 RepID=A0A4Q7VMT2_9BURK|nr:MBL fold metallo-hydrolase [Rivibacter subsaxonicus]RZT97640.1 L-ascorbate metabolism protein UlaG (beta-lactamase superfamily) [Rivibacter subsaxonicus]
MRRNTLRAVLALLVLVLLLGSWITIQWLRRPAVEPYADLALSQAFPVPGKLSIRHAGVSTLVFDDGETAWMTDAFLSRPSLRSVVLGKIQPDTATIERELKRLYVNRLAAVIPLHTHYDHALDSALVAERTGALLVGSASAMQLGITQGLPADRMKQVRSGDTLQLGKFKLTFIASHHSPTPLDDGRTLETIDAPLTLPARASAWRAGEVWSLLVEHASGQRVLVQASAGFAPDALAGKRADAVLLGVGTLGKKDTAYVESYWREVVLATGAKRVIPIHWDNFSLPLDQPLQPMPLLLDDFEHTMNELRRMGARDGVEIRMAPPLLPFRP